MNTVTALLEWLVIDCSIRVSQSYMHFLKRDEGGGGIPLPGSATVM